MRAAVVDLVTFIVINIIVASAETDIAPDGCVLIDVENVPCDIGWVFDPENGTFSAPNA